MSQHEPLSRLPYGPDSIGGPLHTTVAWDFAHTAQRRGVRLLNPMYFPHMLQSSVGCSVAAECGATAFAVTAFISPIPRETLASETGSRIISACRDFMQVIRKDLTIQNVNWTSELEDCRREEFWREIGIIRKKCPNAIMAICDHYEIEPRNPLAGVLGP